MDNFKTRHPFIVNGLKFVVQVFIVFVLFYVWICGMIGISFGLVRKSLPLLYWSAFCLGMLLCSLGVIWSGRKLRLVSYVMMLATALVAGGTALHFWWTEGRFPVVKQDVPWWQYRPFTDNNKLVQVEIPEELRLDGPDDYPKMDGAYALYPIYAAVAQAMYPREIATRHP